MSKELVDLLKRTIRVPWDAHRTPHKPDDIIRARLVSDSGLLPMYSKPPASEAGVVQAIALPILIALIKNASDLIRGEGRWDALTKEEKQLIVKFYGLRDQYRCVMHFVNDVTQIMPLASYMGACYAFTTKHKPLVIDLGDLVTASMSLERGQPSLMDDFRSAGLLIIKGGFGKHLDLKRADGEIFKMLSSRADYFKPTVFFAVPPVLSMARKIARGQDITFDAIEDMIEADDNGKTGLGYFLGGSSTYINFNSNARELNDSRFELSV